MICERCNQKFDRNPEKRKNGRVRSSAKFCPICRTIIRKERAKRTNEERALINKTK